MIYGRLMGIEDKYIAPIIVGLILLIIGSATFWKRIESWTKKLFSRKKKKEKKVIHDPKKRPDLNRLVQLKWGREREIIDQELNKNIRNVMEEFSMKGLLYSGPFLVKAVELHTERIRKLLEARKTINKEVLLNKKPIENDQDIKLAMKDLERIAEAQKFVIFACENALDHPRGKDNFRRKMSENIARLLSNIHRDLVIEKDENLLLKKEK